jgi:hypothetical protein
MYISNKTRFQSVYSTLVEEIKKLLHSFEDHAIKHVRCSGNGVTHRLAKDICDNKVCNCWFGAPPQYLVNYLACDAEL